MVVQASSRSEDGLVPPIRLLMMPTETQVRTQVLDPDILAMAERLGSCAEGAVHYRNEAS
jgi:hypothetical protein